MSDSLKRLGTAREARREVSLRNVATAKRLLDAAHATCQQAFDHLEASRLWRTELLTSCSLGAAPALRESALPACEALLLQRQQAFARAQLELRSAFEHLTEQRRDLANRERDLLGLQEWKKLQQTEARRESARQENQHDDALLLAHPGPLGRTV